MTLIYVLIGFGVSLIVFNINYYLMANLPGSRDNACVMGAGLTPLNIIFSVVLSVLTGIFVVFLIKLFRKRMAKLASTSASGIGLVVGVLTVFCTLCALPVISLFGISLSLSIFVDYNVYFKILSVVLMLGGLYLVNRQLKKGCERCADHGILKL